MKFIDFKRNLKDFIIFSLLDIRKIEADFDLRRLAEWQAKGYIQKIRRGFYAFSDLNLNEETLFLIANKMYAPSYVSLEMALSFYGLIPEGVYSPTSITTRKTEHFKTPFADFFYRSVSPKVFFGYRLGREGNRSYKIAEIEKAVVDYLYLNPHMASEAGFHEWRFSAGDFLAKADMKKLRSYAAAIGQKRFVERTESLIKFLRDHR